MASDNSPATNLPEAIDFFFEFDKDFKIIGSNGAWGGMTPQGDFRIDFFVESVAVPQRVRYKVNANGALGQEFEREPEKRLVRQMQVGVLLSVDTAERVANFILERIRDYRERVEKTKGVSDV